MASLEERMGKKRNEAKSKEVACWSGESTWIGGDFYGITKSGEGLG